MTALRNWRVHGVDFTSRPSPRKAITVATGVVSGDTFDLQGIEALDCWETFERWLRHEGPWIAGFDFPFGLPRAAVIDLGWPQQWPALVDHCRALGRERFRQLLDGYRESRPAGRRYAHRAADIPARSHSPLKLVNPPVGLMFLEGAPRLLDAGVSIPGLHPGDAARIAIEAYPGFGARALSRESYKSDSRAKQTPARTRARHKIVAALVSGAAASGISLRAPKALLGTIERDATGDRLDAVICAMQAAWALQRRDHDFGMPAGVDPLEGWIATVPGA